MTASRERKQRCVRGLAVHIISIAQLLGIWMFAATRLHAEEVCTYTDDQGRIRAVRSRAEAPYQVREQLSCFESGSVGIPYRPEDVPLGGEVRSISMASAIGRIALRWPRSSGEQFQRPIDRIVAEVATGVSRALRRGGFPAHIALLDLDWKIVFLDHTVASRNIPSNMQRGCHPAALRSPADMYVFVDRIMSGCGGGPPLPESQRDAKLAQILLHEFGHGIEFLMLQGGGGLDPARTEGFATWFEQYAASEVSGINQENMTRDFSRRLERSFGISPKVFRFAVNSDEYARAGAYFSVVEKKRGVSAIASMYQRWAAAAPGKPLQLAVADFLGQTPESLNDEIRRTID